MEDTNCQQAEPQEVKKNNHSRIFLYIALFSLIITVFFLIKGNVKATGPFAIALSTSLAMFCRNHRFLSVVSFSLWMITAVIAPLYYPTYFTHWGDIQLKQFIIPMIMTILFCMGTTLSIDDFKRVLTMPFTIVVGVALQYLIMPFVGKAVAMTFAPNPEIAAGIIITGTCPGGVASNVINYLAKANVCLSVTLTAVSTLVSPLFTPILTKFLAGAYVPVDFMKMTIEMIKMVILPVLGGIGVHAFLEKMSKVHSIYSSINDGIMKALPPFSMFIVAITCSLLTASARDRLLGEAIIGSVLIAVFFHNGFGLLLGYWCSKLFGFGEKECRTIAVEVGMQNGGMAAGLAISVFKSQLASIPGVVFSSWHNITGAVLASYWARKPIKEKHKADL